MALTPDPCSPGPGGRRVRGAARTAGGRGCCRWPAWRIWSWSCWRSTGPPVVCVSRRLAGARRLGKLVLGLISVLFFLCAALRAGYLALRPERSNRILCRLPAAVPGDDDPGDLVAPPGPDVGGHGGHHPGHGAAALFQPQRPLPGGDLEVPADRLGGHRPGPAGVVLPGLRVAAQRAWNRRCCSTTSSGTRRGCRRPGCTRPSSCSSSATAPRWAWRPCTPGSRTPTARRPGLVGALLAGGVTSCAFLAILRVYQICQRRRPRPPSPGSS